MLDASQVTTDEYYILHPYNIQSDSPDMLTSYFSFNNEFIIEIFFVSFKVYHVTIQTFGFQMRSPLSS